jgi:hypothetical protein
MKGSTRVLFPQHAPGGVLGLSRLWMNMQSLRKPQLGFTETGLLVRTTGIRSQEQIGKRVFEYIMPSRTVSFTHTGEAQQPATDGSLVDFAQVSGTKPKDGVIVTYHNPDETAETRLRNSVKNLKVAEKLAGDLTEGIEHGTQRDSGELWGLSVYEIPDPRDLKNYLDKPDDWETLRDKYGHYIVVQERFTRPGGLYTSVTSVDAEGNSALLFGRGRPLKDRDYGAMFLERPYRPVRS